MSLTLNKYQEQTRETAIYQTAIDTFVNELEIPNNGKAQKLKNLLGFTYVVLGMVGEAGELANKLKKVIRDSNGEINLSDMLQLAKENGDMTWYNARAFEHLGFTFQEGAEMNLKKLFERKLSNSLQGSGDNR